MGANSIDISQYRSRIGTFSNKKLVCHNGSSSPSIGNGLKMKNLLESFIMLSYLLILSGVTRNLLIMSGVEINPGPFSLDKTTAKKETEANHQVVTATEDVKRKQDVYSGAIMATSNTWSSTTPKIQQPKVDATNRRQIEAQNEDKSHTTKEELDDIKCTHYKEKAKKEQSIMEPGPSGINNQRQDSNIAGIGNTDSFAWDPKYAMTTKNTKKNKTQFSAAPSPLHATATKSEGKPQEMKLIDPAKLSGTNQKIGLKPSGIKYPSIIKTGSQHDDQISISKQSRINSLVKGKERNQERILNQAAYDHDKTKSNRVSGPRNKGKYPVHPKANMLLNDINTIEVEKDFISTLPTEITEMIMKNLSESKDIISFALASKYAMAMIPRLQKEIVVTEESIIKELLQSVEGRRAVCKLICFFNGKKRKDNASSSLFYDETFAFNCHGVTIKLQSAVGQHDLFPEILNKCPKIDEILIKDDTVEQEDLLDFTNFKILGLPSQGNLTENDIKILSTKLPNLKNLILIRSGPYGSNHGKIQVIAPNGLVQGWSVNFYLSDYPY